MKIKEVFKDCAFCYHVYFDIWRDDKFDKLHHIDTCEIHKLKDFDDFINAYGNEEILGWSVENNKDNTHFTFCLKRK